MNLVAVYNMKGGVGKTTAAVNLSYLAASGGQRTLLWDLDPQAASSFAFRVRPRVAGFGRKSLESGRAFAGAIKETDYANLDVLPADFAYRKLDRLLERSGKPERTVASLLDTIGRDYDAVFLDCPAGFSRLTEGVVAAADAVLVPTIPTLLSLRTLARLIKWVERSEATSMLSAFFSMVDRRKLLHRRACEWSVGHPDVFLTGQIPYASVVEQMAVERKPLAVFAPRDSATTAFEAIWAELQRRLQERGRQHPPGRLAVLRAIESLIVRLDSMEAREAWASRQTAALDAGSSGRVRDHRGVSSSHLPAAPGNRSDGSAQKGKSPGTSDVHFVHRFDTESRDLERCGYIVELRERTGEFFVVAGRVGSDDSATTTGRVQVRIDSSWAWQILSGVMSPLAALECRLGRPLPGQVGQLREEIGGLRLRRLESRVDGLWF